MILVVPMCVLVRPDRRGGLGMVDIFAQIGFVVLVGLACKNAILIVEFAKRDRELGRSPGAVVAPPGYPAAADHDDLGVLYPHGAAVLRFGAGAEMRRSLGTAVLWGAFGVTLFGIFLTPVVFYGGGLASPTGRGPAPAGRCAAPTGTIPEVAGARATPGISIRGPAEPHTRRP